MLLLHLVAIALTHPAATVFEVDLALVRPEVATGYHGCLVRSTFTLTCPPCTLGDVTAVGTGLDGVARTALLPKDLSLDKGDEVTVVGVLGVRGHPGVFVGPVFVPAWTEIRLDPAVAFRSPRR